MTGAGDSRGILYPSRLPSFHREAVPVALDGLLRWFWIPQWDLPPGRTSRQEVLSFPAANLVVQPEVVTLVGPTTRVSHRDLRGSGWAVGASLRPAGTAVLHPDPGSLRDDEVVFEAPDLHRAIATAMGHAGAEGRRRAMAAFTAWATEHLPPPGKQGLMANAMEDLIASDRSVVQVDQVAQQLAVSVRGVQRLARRYVGLPPLAIIRRYRLQEAAQRLRADAQVTIAQVAADLGYADHAHLTVDFRRVVGYTPNSYRQDAGRHR